MTDNCLKTYNQLYSIHPDDRLQRLLMEGDDLYIYFWIKDGRKLTNAQIVWQDKYVLNLKYNQNIHSGTIERFPFNRSISSPLSVKNKTDLLKAFNACSSDTFPGILSIIKSWAPENDPMPPEVSKGERDKLSLLCCA